MLNNRRAFRLFKNYQLISRIYFFLFLKSVLPNSPLDSRGSWSTYFCIRKPPSSIWKSPYKGRHRLCYLRSVYKFAFPHSSFPQSSWHSWPCILWFWLACPLRMFVCFCDRIRSRTPWWLCPYYTSGSGFYVHKLFLFQLLTLSKKASDIFRGHIAENS